MLLIPCPWCGPRAESEFSCAGEARASVSGGEGLDEEGWADRLYGRDNLRGEAPELWWHVHGCQQWLLVRRDTLTHSVRDAVPALAALIPGAAKETGQSDLVSGAAQETATLGALEPAAAEADTAASSASYDTAPGALR